MSLETTISTAEVALTIEIAFKNLIGLQIFKSWNVFATRMFYFASPGVEDSITDGDCRLTLECPWRIEQNERILVGSEDYGLRAVGNNDPAWDPRNAQWGHLQDQKLQEIFGSNANPILNTASNLILQSVSADALGSFRLFLSGGYIVSVFPASVGEMEWLLSGRLSRNLALVGGVLTVRSQPG